MYLLVKFPKKETVTMEMGQASHLILSTGRTMALLVRQLE